MTQRVACGRRHAAKSAVHGLGLLVRYTGRGTKQNSLVNPYTRKTHARTNNRMQGDNAAAIGSGICRFVLRIFGPLCDIGVGGRVKPNSNIGDVNSTTDIAKIAINVEKVPSDTLAIDVKVLKADTNIAEASSNISATQIAGPEAPSYLGETCFGGPDAGSNTANSSADGRGLQCDIVEIDFNGQEMNIDMSRTRSNVARVHSDRRGDECNVNVFHINIQNGGKQWNGLYVMR